MVRKAFGRWGNASLSALSLQYLSLPPSPLPNFCSLPMPCTPCSLPQAPLALEERFSFSAFLLPTFPASQLLFLHLSPYALCPFTGHLQHPIWRLIFGRILHTIDDRRRPWRPCWSVSAQTQDILPAPTRPRNFDNTAIFVD